MNVLILAAGYGTRLQRDLQNEESQKHAHLMGLPKALLPIGGQALISHWTKLLSPVQSIQKILVLVNDKYYEEFLTWQKSNDFANVEVLSDGTSSNETRLGAVGSIQFAVKTGNLAEHPLLVIGGDTLLDVKFDIGEFLEKADRNSEIQTLVTAYTVNDEETRKYGILETSENGRVIGFREKPNPDETASRLACPCFYYFKPSVFKHLDSFLMEKANGPLQDRDATGLLLRYLHDKVGIYISRIPGRFDVGNLQQYIEANIFFMNRQQ